MGELDFENQQVAALNISCEGMNSSSQTVAQGGPSSWKMNPTKWKSYAGLCSMASIPEGGAKLCFWYEHAAQRAEKKGLRELTAAKFGVSENWFFVQFEAFGTEIWPTFMLKNSFKQGVLWTEKEAFKCIITK